MQLISDFPWYFLLLCALLGGLGSSALYLVGKEHRAKFSKPLRWTLSALRFLSIMLIAALLLAPLVKRERHEKERPIVLLAQDNSQSLSLSRDSAFYRGQYPEKIADLVAELSKDYEVRTYTYGESLKEGNTLDFSEGATDMSAALSDLKSRYEGRNVGAVILSGDGIYNLGLNPIQCAEGLPYPIYTIALGDTTLRADASVSHLRFNRIAYLGNQFPVEITVVANKLKGQQKQLSVQHDGKTIFSKTLVYDADHFSTTEQLLIDAEKAGVQHYTVHIAECSGEVSTKNNSRSFSVEVIDGHQKVAIVAAAPHPDVAALRQSLQSNQNYEVESFLMGDFRASAADYDLLILHNLPTRSGMPSQLAQLPKDVPVMFVVGSLTDLARLSSLHLGLEISTRLNKINESLPLYNNAFSFFTLSDDIVKRLEKMPPLTAPFGDYRLSSNSQSLFLSKIGTVNSGLPLVAFSQKEGVRYAFICGEGLWRWRLEDFRENNSHDAFNTFINKSVVYTSMKADKERFHIEHKALYRAGEEVVVEAMLYNENYELVNEPEVLLSLHSNSGNEVSSFSFNRTSNAYGLKLGNLDAGTYTFSAETTLAGKKLTKSGTFVVEALQLEDLDLVANHSLLNTLAHNSNGAMLYPADLERIPALLKERDDIKSVIFTQTKYSELLNLPWIFILLVLLLGAEWFTRKYNGEI